MLEIDGLRILATSLNSDSVGTTAQDVAQFAAQVKARLVEGLTEAAAVRQAARKEEAEEEAQRKQEQGSKKKKKKKSSGGGGTSIGDSFRARIVARLVDNIVIKFSNIHLRFETETTNDRDSAVALDFRIGGITVQSAVQAQAQALREHAAGAGADGGGGGGDRGAEYDNDGVDAANYSGNDEDEGSDDGGPDGNRQGFRNSASGAGPKDGYKRTKTDKQVTVVDYCLSCVSDTPTATSLSALVAAECTRESIVDAFDALGAPGGICDTHAIVGPASVHGTIAADAPLLPSDPGLPAYAVDLDLRSVQVVVTDMQYSRLKEVAAVLQRIQFQLVSAHLRPRQSVTASPVSWWRYGADAHLAQHPRRRSAWCWTTIKAHCDKRRVYIDLCIKALADPTDEELMASVKAHEQFMSPYRIVLYRQLARCESLFERVAGTDSSGGGGSGNVKKKSGRFNVKKTVKSLLKLKKKPGDDAAKLEAEFDELRSELEGQLELESSAAQSELTSAELVVRLKVSRFDIALFAEPLTAGASAGASTTGVTADRRSGTGTGRQFDGMLPVCKITVGGVAVRSFTGLQGLSNFECTVDKVDLLLPGADGALRHAMTPTGRGRDRRPVFAGVSEAPCLLSRSIAALVVETVKLPQALDAVQAQSDQWQQQPVRSKSRFSAKLEKIRTTVAGYILPVELKLTQAGALALTRFFTGTPPGASFESPRAHPVVRLNETLAAKVRRHQMTAVFCVDAPTVVMAASDDSDPTTPMVIVDLGSHIIKAGETQSSDGVVDSDGDSGAAVSAKEETVSIEGTGLQVLVACRSDEWRASQRLVNSEHHVIARMQEHAVVDKTYDTFNIACRVSDCNIQLPAARLEQLVRIIQAWAAVLTTPPILSRAPVLQHPRNHKLKRRRGPAMVAPRTVGTTAVTLSCPTIRVGFGEASSNNRNGCSGTASQNEMRGSNDSSSSGARPFEPAAVATLVDCKMVLVATDLAAHCNWTVRGGVVLNSLRPEAPQIVVHSIAANRDGATRASADSVETALRSNPKPSVLIKWNNKMFPLETATDDNTCGGTAATAVVKGGSVGLSDWMVLFDRDPCIELVEALSDSVLAVQRALAASAASAAADLMLPPQNPFATATPGYSVPLPLLPRRRGRDVLRWAQKKMAGTSSTSSDSSAPTFAASMVGESDYDDFSTFRIGPKGQKIWTDKANPRKSSTLASDWTVTISEVSLLLLHGTPILRANIPRTDATLKRRAAHTQLEIALSRIQVLDLLTPSPASSRSSSSSSSKHHQHRQIIGARRGHSDGCVKVDLKFVNAKEEPHELKIGIFHLEAVVLRRISAELSGFMTPLFAAVDRSVVSRAAGMAEYNTTLSQRYRPARPARPTRKPSSEEMACAASSNTDATSTTGGPRSIPTMAASIHETSIIESMYMSCIDADDGSEANQPTTSSSMPTPARTMCAVRLELSGVTLLLPASSARADGIVLSIPSVEAEFWATEVDGIENASDWKCTTAIKALECRAHVPLAPLAATTLKGDSAERRQSQNNPGSPGSPGSPDNTDSSSYQQSELSAPFLVCPTIALNASYRISAAGNTSPSTPVFVNPRQGPQIQRQTQRGARGPQEAGETAFGFVYTGLTLRISPDTLLQLNACMKGNATEAATVCTPLPPRSLDDEDDDNDDIDEVVRGRSPSTGSTDSRSRLGSSSSSGRPTAPIGRSSSMPAISGNRMQAARAAAVRRAREKRASGRISQLNSGGSGADTVDGPRLRAASASSVGEEGWGQPRRSKQRRRLLSEEPMWLQRLGKPPVPAVRIGMSAETITVCLILGRATHRSGQKDGDRGGGREKGRGSGGGRVAAAAFPSSPIRPFLQRVPHSNHEKKAATSNEHGRANDDAESGGDTVCTLVIKNTNVLVKSSPISSDELSVEASIDMVSGINLCAGADAAVRHFFASSISELSPKSESPRRPMRRAGSGWDAGSDAEQAGAEQTTEQPFLSARVTKTRKSIRLLGKTGRSFRNADVRRALVSHRPVHLQMLPGFGGGQVVLVEFATAIDAEAVMSEGVLATVQGVADVGWAPAAMYGCEFHCGVGTVLLCPILLSSLNQFVADATEPGDDVDIASQHSVATSADSSESAMTDLIADLLSNEHEIPLPTCSSVSEDGAREASPTGTANKNTGSPQKVGDPTRFPASLPCPWAPCSMCQESHSTALEHGLGFNIKLAVDGIQVVVHPVRTAPAGRALVCTIKGDGQLRKDADTFYALIDLQDCSVVSQHIGSGGGPRLDCIPCCSISGTYRKTGKERVSIAITCDALSARFSTDELELVSAFKFAMLEEERALASASGASQHLQWDQKLTAIAASRRKRRQWAFERFTTENLTMRVNYVNLTLVDCAARRHRPLFLASANLEVEAHDWSTTMEASICSELAVSILEQKRSVWEPLIISPPDALDRVQPLSVRADIRSSPAVWIDHSAVSIVTHSTHMKSKQSVHKLFDGKDGTYWNGGKAIGDNYVVIQLRRVTTLSRFRYRVETSDDYAPRDNRLEVAETPTGPWTEVLHFFGQPQVGIVTSPPFVATGKFWRWRIGSRHGRQPAHIGSIEFEQPAGGTMVEVMADQSIEFTISSDTIKMCSKLIERLAAVGVAGGDVGANVASSAETNSNTNSVGTANGAHMLVNRTGHAIAVSQTSIYDPATAQRIDDGCNIALEFRGRIYDKFRQHVVLDKKHPITHIDVIDTAKGHLPPRGWSLIKRNLNHGKGLASTFLIFKRESGARPVTDVWVRLGKGEGTLCDEPLPEATVGIDVDIYNGTGARPAYVCFRRGNCLPITDMVVIDKSQNEKIPTAYTEVARSLSYGAKDVQGNLVLGLKRLRFDVRGGVGAGDNNGKEGAGAAGDAGSDRATPTRPTKKRTWHTPGFISEIDIVSLPDIKTNPNALLGAPGGIDVPWISKYREGTLIDLTLGRGNSTFLLHRCNPTQGAITAIRIVHSVAFTEREEKVATDAKGGDATIPTPTEATCPDTDDDGDAAGASFTVISPAKSAAHHSAAVWERVFPALNIGAELVSVDAAGSDGLVYLEVLREDGAHPIDAIDFIFPESEPVPDGFQILDTLIGPTSSSSWFRSRQLALVYRLGDLAPAPAMRGLQSGTSRTTRKVDAGIALLGPSRSVNKTVAIHTTVRIPWQKRPTITAVPLPNPANESGVTRWTFACEPISETAFSVIASRADQHTGWSQELSVSWSISIANDGAGNGGGGGGGDIDEVDLLAAAGGGGGANTVEGNRAADEPMGIAEAPTEFQAIAVLGNHGLKIPRISFEVEGWKPLSNIEVDESATRVFILEPLWKPSPARVAVSIAVDDNDCLTIQIASPVVVRNTFDYPIEVCHQETLNDDTVLGVAAAGSVLAVPVGVADAYHYGEIMVPLHAFWNDSTRAAFYSTSTLSTKGLSSAFWMHQAALGYVYKSRVPQTIALWGRTPTDHNDGDPTLTTNVARVAKDGIPGWQRQTDSDMISRGYSVIGYVYPRSQPRCVGLGAFWHTQFKTILFSTEPLHPNRSLQHRFLGFECFLPMHHGALRIRPVVLPPGRRKHTPVADQQGTQQQQQQQQQQQLATTTPVKKSFAFAGPSMAAAQGPAKDSSSKPPNVTFADNWKWSREEMQTLCQSRHARRQLLCPSKDSSRAHIFQCEVTQLHSKSNEWKLEAPLYLRNSLPCVMYVAITMGSDEPPGSHCTVIAAGSEVGVSMFACTEQFKREVDIRAQNYSPLLYLWVSLVATESHTSLFKGVAKVGPHDPTVSKDKHHTRTDAAIKVVEVQTKEVIPTDLIEAGVAKIYLRTLSDSGAQFQCNTKVLSAHSFALQIVRTDAATGWSEDVSVAWRVATGEKTASPQVSLGDWSLKPVPIKLTDGFPKHLNAEGGADGVVGGSSSSGGGSADGGGGKATGTADAPNSDRKGGAADGNGAGTRTEKVQVMWSSENGDAHDLHLGIQQTRRYGTFGPLITSIFCPYLISNSTGMELAFSVDGAEDSLWYPEYSRRGRRKKGEKGEGKEKRRRSETLPSSPVSPPSLSSPMEGSAGRSACVGLYAPPSREDDNSMVVGLDLSRFKHVQLAPKIRSVLSRAAGIASQPVMLDEMSGMQRISLSPVVAPKITTKAKRGASISASSSTKGVRGRSASNNGTISDTDAGGHTVDKRAAAAATSTAQSTASTSNQPGSSPDGSDAVCDICVYWKWGSPARLWRHIEVFPACSFVNTTNVDLILGYSDEAEVRSGGSLLVPAHHRLDGEIIVLAGKSVPCNLSTEGKIWRVRKQTTGWSSPLPLGGELDAVHVKLLRHDGSMGLVRVHVRAAKLHRTVVFSRAAIAAPVRIENHCTNAMLVFEQELPKGSKQMPRRYMLPPGEQMCYDFDDGTGPPRIRFAVHQATLQRTKLDGTAAGAGTNSAEDDDSDDDAKVVAVGLFEKEPFTFSYRPMDATDVRTVAGLVRTEGATRVFLLADSIVACRRALGLPAAIPNEQLVIEWTLVLPGVGLSVIESAAAIAHAGAGTTVAPQELLYLTATGVLINYARTTQYIKRYITVTAIQLDHQVPEYDFDVVVRHWIKDDKDEPVPFLQAARVTRRAQYGEGRAFDTEQYVVAALQPLLIRVDDVLLRTGERLSAMIRPFERAVNAMIDARNNEKVTAAVGAVRSDQLDADIDGVNAAVADAGAAAADDGAAVNGTAASAAAAAAERKSTTRVLMKAARFFETVELTPIELYITTALSESTHLRRHFNRMGVAQRTALVTIGKVNELPIKFTGLQLKDAILDPQQLLSKLYYHLLSESLEAMSMHGLVAKANMLSSLEIIGSAGTAVRNLGAGIHELIYEPARAAIQQPEAFGEKLGQGTQRFASGVIGGVSGMASKITGSLGSGLAVLSLDEDYQKDRLDQRRKTISTSKSSGGGAAGSGANVAAGVSQFGRSVVSGVTGLWEQPIKGGQEGGFIGGLEGFGKGVAGLVFKPVGGVVDMVQGSFAGIESLASISSAAIRRIRDPRFVSPTGIIGPYSRHKAMGMRFIAENFERSFLDHVYVSHLSEEIGGGRVRMTFLLYRTVLVITAKGKAGFRSPRIEQEIESSRIAGLRAVAGEGVELWYSDSGVEMLSCSNLNSPKLCGMLGELIALHRRGHRPVSTEDGVVFFDPPQYLPPLQQRPEAEAAAAAARSAREFETAEVDVWENQRRYLWSGFKSALLPTERSNWSSSAGKKQPPKDAMAPDNGWGWPRGSSWQIDLSVGGAEGWEFSAEFSGRLSRWSRKYDKKLHFVRRRRWVRLQQKQRATLASGYGGGGGGGRAGGAGAGASGETKSAKRWL